MCDYLFTSKRLGFRNWKSSDVDLLFKINSDKKVMHFFPTKLTKGLTVSFIERMQKEFKKNNFCYFAVEIIATKEFIGFIGLSKQVFKADFNPSIDIGWRLHPNFWHQGFATEGAKTCLEYAFYQLKLKKIIAIAPKINFPSIAVMKKIGMQKVKDFEHPLLIDFQSLKNCVLYEIREAQFIP